MENRAYLERPEEPSVWRPLEGWASEYRISDLGTVQKKVRGQWKDIKSYMGKRGMYIKLQRPDRTHKTVSLTSLMAAAFFDGLKPGYCLAHRNGMKGDVTLFNLEMVSEREARRRGGRKQRRPVKMIDREKHVVAYYSSVGEAARENYVSKKAVYSRCLRQVRDPFALLGYDFRYDR